MTCQPASWTNRWKGLAAGSYTGYTFAGTWSDQWKQDKIAEAFDLWTEANLNSGLNTSFGPPLGSLVLTLRNVPIPNDATTGLPVAAGVLDGSTVDQNGILTSATIAWNTNTSVLSDRPGYLKTALHEIGHTLGLGDLHGGNGSSVMNQMGGLMTKMEKCHK